MHASQRSYHDPRLSFILTFTQLCLCLCTALYCTTMKCIRISISHIRYTFYFSIALSSASYLFLSPTPSNYLFIYPFIFFSIPLFLRLSIFLSFHSKGCRSHRWEEGESPLFPSLTWSRNKNQEGKECECKFEGTRIIGRSPHLTKICWL